MSGVPRVLSSPVTKIDYSGSNVVVTTTNATYTGRTVIVTPSVGVLNSNTITFSPALPPAFSTAIGNLRMGNVYKGVLGFKSDVFSGKAGVPPGAMTYIAPLIPVGQPAGIVNFWQHKMVMLYADADLATTYENMGADAAAALLAVLETHFPGATAAWDGRFAGTAWTSNTFTRGAYAFVTPGNANARVLLQAGISSKVWFAGEALSVSSHGAQHAAYISGTNAAYAALGSLGLIAAGQLAPAATKSI
jgi:monoamine oxidase